MRACVSHGLEREKEEKETEKKEGELYEKEIKRERINKRSVCDECIRIDTNIRRFTSKTTILLLINQEAHLDKCPRYEARNHFMTLWLMSASPPFLLFLLPQEVSRKFLLFLTII